MACGALAGAAGVLVAARTGLISPSIGQGLEFFAIAVVALGAGGLPAGRVRVSQTVIGTLILIMIFNYMTIRGVPGTWQTTVTGLLLLGAMVAGRFLQRDAASDVATGEAISDEYARMSPTGAWLTRSALAIATIVLAIVFALINPRFAIWPNVVAIVEQNATLAIVAVGAMIGIVSRSVDISPGSVIALGAVAAALAAQAGVPLPLALLAGILTCLAVYALNGVIVGRLGLDPLIVTLAAWIWARGLAISLTDATTIGFDMRFVMLMNTPLAFGFTLSVPLIALAFLAGWIILRRMPLGIRIYAAGGDPRMLRQAGVNESRLRVTILLAMGFFTAAGMLVMLGFVRKADRRLRLELDAIVAVILARDLRHRAVRDTAIGVLFLAIQQRPLRPADGINFLDQGTIISPPHLRRRVSRGGRWHELARHRFRPHIL